MGEDVLSLLQSVKQAEEEKVKAIAEAKEKAAARIKQAEAFAAGISQEVSSRVAKEEPLLKKESDETARRDSEKLNEWRKQGLERLRSAQSQRKEKSFESLCKRFLEEWPA